MMMGIGLAVVTLGAILRYAIDSTGDEFNLPVVGLILMIVGGVAFLTGTGLEYMKRRALFKPLPPQAPTGQNPYGGQGGQPPYTPPSGQPPQSQPPQHPPQHPH